MRFFFLLYTFIKKRPLMHTKITGTGCYIPKVIQTNNDFLDHKFHNSDGSEIVGDSKIVIDKFVAITGIEERRYVEENKVTSQIAYEAAKQAIKASGIDAETLDYIIVAHNYGDIKHGTIQSDTVPSLASRVKHLLKIENPYCVAYDMMFGCPGWIESIIQAHAFIKSSMAKKCLVIGAETLSRVVDPHDRDSMIYSDGAGACILEASEEDDKGIIAHKSASFTYDEVKYLFFGGTYDSESPSKTQYIKMYGRKIYNFALTHVPDAMKECLDESGYNIQDIKKILIHQANEKMDEAIVERFYKLYNQEMPKDVMPMTIHKLGNSSVATVPTLLDMILNDKVEGHQINEGDVVIFASVGAGMNINAIVYKF